MEFRDVFTQEAETIDPLVSQELSKLPLDTLETLKNKGFINRKTFNNAYILALESKDADLFEQISGNEVLKNALLLQDDLASVIKNYKLIIATVISTETKGRFK